MKKSSKESKKKKQIYLLIFLVLVLIAIDYPLIDKALENFFVDYEIGFVERVIDGDTIVVNGTNVRLLGINSPETGEEYSKEAKNYLENLTLNKLVKMKKSKEDKDLYGRSLRYIFVDTKNVNLNLVERGFANFYFPSGKDSYYQDMKKAWERCLTGNRNLCQQSQERCASCIKIKEFDVRNQKIVFENSCSFYCDLTDYTIKDEGRKKFIFPSFVLEKKVTIIVGEGENTKDSLFWTGEDYVWTETGDTLFLRDQNNKLVLWRSY